MLAGVAADLLRGTALDDVVERLTGLAAAVVRVGDARLELGDASPGAGERGLPLAAGRRVVATLVVDERDEIDDAVVERFLPALAALLAVALDRAALQAEAFEAEALRRSDALKTALLRSVSHDLRSPLTAILASAGGLANPELALDDADRAGLVETIRAEARRLDRVVGNLLDLSRLEAGAADPHLELWSVDELVGQAIESVPEGAERVVVELDPDAPPVRADAAQVERAIANLVENALRYSPAGSRVLVRVEQGGRELRIHVLDHGPGLSDAERNAVFAPFRRGAGAEGRGAGLGLAIARGFVEANGGHLWAQADTAGGHFVLSLETAKRPAARV